MRTHGLVALVVGWMLVVPAPGLGSLDGARVEREFPVRGETSYSRYHHDYPAADLFASCGRRVVAPVDGTILELSRRDRWDPATNRGGQRGGKFLSIRGDDGVRYYLSHFSGIRGRVDPADRVRAGEHIAWVGRTGSARGTPCHVHFGLSPVCRGVGDWAVRRGVVAPYRFLRSWEQGQDRSPRRAVRSWRDQHGCR
jgi:murein DD-endopeptidase MepM/ murein hydrolase activator NlpD